MFLLKLDNNLPQVITVSDLLFFCPQIYQSALDRWTPHTKARWVASVVLLLVFLLRVFAKQVS